MLRFWKGTLFISTGALQGDIGIYEGCGQITFVASVEYQTYAIIIIITVRNIVYVITSHVCETAPFKGSGHYWYSK